jgi:hypothetical protein
MSRVIADGLSDKVLAKGLTFTGDIAAPEITATTKMAIKGTTVDVPAFIIAREDNDATPLLTIQPSQYVQDAVNPGVLLGSNNRDMGLTAVVSPDSYEDISLVLKTNGRVGIGTPTPNQKLDVNGSIRTSTGVLFGTDTAASNTLDDYEEGTWTPTPNGDATGVISTGTNGSYYIKVGRDVTIYMNLSVTTTFSSNTLGGLPFTPDHAGLSSTFVSGGLVLGGANNLVSAGVRDDESLIYLFSNQNQSDFHILTPTINFYRLQFSYRTA